MNKSKNNIDIAHWSNYRGHIHITWVPNGGVSDVVDSRWNLSLDCSGIDRQYNSLAIMKVVADERHKDVLSEVGVLGRYWLLVKFINLGVGLTSGYHSGIDEGDTVVTGNTDFIVVSGVQLQYRYVLRS